MRYWVKKLTLDKSVIKFMITGTVCTLIDYLLYIIFTDYVGLVIGKTFSMICSMSVNYTLNKLWTFSVKTKRCRNQIMKYGVAQFFNIMINVSVNYLLLCALQSKIIAFIGATGVAMIVNFCLQKFWVFGVNRDNSL